MIATLVTGLVGLFPVSLVLGGLWVRRHGRQPGRARTVVLTGMTASVIWAVVGIFAVTAVVRGSIPEYQDPASLTVGRCFTSNGAAGPVGQVPVQACTRSHDAEAFAIVDPEGVSLQATQDLVAVAARKQCLPKLAEYVVDPWGLPAGTQLGFYYGGVFAALKPIICFVDLPAPVTHSVRMDSSTLTADQYRFVASLRQVYDLRVQARDADGTPFEASRDAAGQVATALTQEDQLFTSGGWPPAARPALARLAAAQELAVSAWQKAGDVLREQDFAALRAQAERLMRDDLQVAVRTALGLPIGQTQTAV